MSIVTVDSSKDGTGAWSAAELRDLPSPLRRALRVQLKELVHLIEERQADPALANKLKAWAARRMERLFRAQAAPAIYDLPVRFG